MDKNYKPEFKKPYEMPILKKIEYDDGLRFTLYQGKNDNQWYDFRYFSKDGLPTRRGVRLPTSIMNDVINVHEQFSGDMFNAVYDEIKLNEVKKSVKEAFKKEPREKAMTGRKREHSPKREERERDSSPTVSDIEYPVKNKK